MLTYLHYAHDDMYFYSDNNIADSDSKSKFKYEVDLCSGVSCSKDRNNECVSDLIIILYS